MWLKQTFLNNNYLHILPFVLHAHCFFSSGIGHPTLTKETDCTYHFEWNTTYACDQSLPCTYTDSAGPVYDFSRSVNVLLCLSLVITLWSEIVWPTPQYQLLRVFRNSYTLCAAVVGDFCMALTEQCMLHGGRQWQSMRWSLLFVQAWL